MDPGTALLQDAFPAYERGATATDDAALVSVHYTPGYSKGLRTDLLEAVIDRFDGDTYAVTDAFYYTPDMPREDYHPDAVPVAEDLYDAVLADHVEGPHRFYDDYIRGGELRAEDALMLHEDYDTALFCGGWLLACLDRALLVMDAAAEDAADPAATPVVPELTFQQLPPEVRHTDADYPGRYPGRATDDGTMTMDAFTAEAADHHETRHLPAQVEDRYDTADLASYLR